MELFDRVVVGLLKSSRLYDWLRLKGYVAFGLPRTVTALGGLLILGIGAEHVYVVTTEAKLPTYFDIYSGVLVLGCLAVAGALWSRAKPSVPQRAWFLGDLLSALFIASYLVSRVIRLPGLVAVTGRWDFVPATLAAAFSAAFLAVHMSILLGINVAYPQQRNWTQ